MIGYLIVFVVAAFSSSVVAHLNYRRGFQRGHRAGFDDGYKAAVRDHWNRWDR